MTPCRGKRLAWALFAIAFAAPGVSSAQPIRTWGGELTPPEAPGTPPSPPTVAPPSPPPPGVTLGTPIEGSEAAPSAPPRAPDEDEGPHGVVRTQGRVGLRYLLEGVEVRGNTTTLARVVLRYVPFHPGDSLDVDDKELELTRFRLLGTGFFRDVHLSLRRGSRRGNAVLVIDVTERNTIVVNNVWLGLSTDADPSGSTRPLTAYGGLDVAETNLAGTGVTLGAAFALANNQLALRARFADPQFVGSNWTVESQLVYNNALDFFGYKGVLVDEPAQIVQQDYATVSYRRFGGLVGAGHDLGISTQLFFNYRLEKIDATVPLAASTQRGSEVVPINFDIFDGTSVLSTVGATLVHDTRDSVLLPTRGEYMLVTADASLTPLGSEYPYFKATISASKWFPLRWGHVLRLEGFAGGVFGTAPMFEMFYVGDLSDLLPDRALGLAFDRRASPDFLNTDIVFIRYGSYAAKLNVEYRIPLYHGHHSIYGIDLFGSTGIYGLANPEDITNHATGFNGLSSVPIDLTFNLGLKIDTQVGGFTFGLSNFLGFIPNRGTSTGTASQ